MSRPLDRINAHLRQLKAEVAAFDGGIDDRRRLLDRYFQVDTAVTRHEARLVPVDFGVFSGEWILDAHSDPDDRMLYLHGGSWVAGNVASYRPLVARLAAVTGCAVLAIDYRLAPEHPYPAGLSDALSAFQWLTANGPDGPATARRRVIAGDSAGGNLALAAILKLKLDQLALPGAAVAFAPPTDLTWASPSMQRLADRDVIINAALLPAVSAVYLKDASATDPTVSPLFGDLEGLPPVLLQVSDAEVLLDDSVRFAEAAGDIVKLEVYADMPHVFQGFAPLLPDAVKALDAVADFLGNG
ncbi:MAG: alpha/beta hydrolase [Gammaproteobacteria bacterium]|nr:alpha/beta hydrolase [Gammaproteobacteria bacterium]